MDDQSLMPQPAPTAALPLLGQTVLVVEDSRFSSEALRLMCLRSGARFRRADCLASANRHLRIFRPSVVIVDLGLPDGSGEGLIQALVKSPAPVGVLLGTSGDDNAQDRVLDLAQSLDHVGPLTRSSLDAGIMFDVIAGHDSNDPTSLPGPVAPAGLAPDLNVSLPLTGLRALLTLLLGLRLALGLAQLAHPFTQGFHRIRLIVQRL